jgi:hypothetical protein
LFDLRQKKWKHAKEGGNATFSRTMSLLPSQSSAKSTSSRKAQSGRARKDQASRWCSRMAENSPQPKRSAAGNHGHPAFYAWPQKTVRDD